MIISTHRRWRPIVVSVLALVPVLLAACSGSSSTTAPLAAALIADASTNFTKDTSLHFKLLSKNIKPSTFAVLTADGDVARPDKLKATATVEPLAGLQAGIAVVFINQQQYLDLGATGKYSKTTILPDLLLIFDASKGIGAILTKFKSAAAITAEDADGVACWKLIGTVDSTVLAPITGSSTATSSPVATTLWIGQSDKQIHKVFLKGKAADDDTDATERTFTLSKFNTPVTITAPAGS